jgi:hypothetical protein
MTSAKESDLLQKVKSVDPKLTSGMHKVRLIDQVLYDECQGV